jgi:hypothetical protein
MGCHDEEGSDLPKRGRENLYKEETIVRKQLIPLDSILSLCRCRAYAHRLETGEEYLPEPTPVLQ